MKEHYNIPLTADQNGMLGRQCHRKECRKYFKIKGSDYAEYQNKEIFCPYCGSKEYGNNMFTDEQMEYAKSIIMKDVMEYLNDSFKKLERKPDPHALFSIGISYTPGRVEIKKYVERELKKTATCEKCKKIFSIYSVSSFCPFCGPRDPLTIYVQNIDLVTKFINLRDIIPDDDKSDLEEHGFFDKIIEKSLDMIVTAFETYCKSKYVTKEISISSESDDEVLNRIRNFFQNLKEANKLLSKFNIDISGILGSRFPFVLECFEKRHVFIHNSGIVDQKFIDRTGKSQDLLGKKIILDKKEIKDLIQELQKVISEIESKLTI